MRDSSIGCLLVVTVGVIGCTGVSVPDPGIRGVWHVVERSFTTPDTSWAVSDPQPGQYFFGATHFSVQEIHETGPRMLFGDQTTDLERLAAFEVFHANSGTYEVTDSTLTIVPTVAKSPNFMDGRSYGYDYAIDGNRLTITRRSGDETRVTTLVRVE